MANPLFSTYSQGENRITATILAVFERLSFALVEQILQALLQEPETQLLTYDNQPAGLTTVPDARIRASFSYWIETKRERGDVREKQLQGHLKALDAEPFVQKQRLLVLTRDAEEPDAVVGLDDRRVVWANFQDLVTAIEQALRLSLDETWVISERHIPTERERELLRELVRFLNSEGLLELAQEQVLVVAARFALPEYTTIGAYICQPNRSFQPSSHMAFYAGGRIHRCIPAIQQGSVDAVTLSEEHVRVRTDLGEDTRERLLALVGRLRQEASPTYGQHNKVIFLSSPQAPETIHLAHDIRNDLVSQSGRTTAFTQGHRYVPLASIRAAPETTTELLSLATRERHRHSPLLEGDLATDTS